MQSDDVDIEQLRIPQSIPGPPQLPPLIKGQKLKSVSDVSTVYLHPQISIVLNSPDISLVKRNIFCITIYFYSHFYIVLINWDFSDNCLPVYLFNTNIISVTFPNK